MRARARTAAAFAALACVVAACSSGNGSAPPTPSESASASASDGPLAISLITKNASNPFFVAMQESAQAEADSLGVKLSLAAGTKDGDEKTQIQAIDYAISQGDRGILITPNGPGVNSAIEKARAAGLFVIALDTPPDPPDTVELTFATDNFRAGQLIGEWTAGRLQGRKATIAMLDVFYDKVVSVDVARDTGFLTGMGIEVPDKRKTGSEAPKGKYSGGQYVVVCHEPTEGTREGGRTAMGICLNKNPAINVVYAINEPAADGAYAELKAAGKESGVLIASVDGGCRGVQAVRDGALGATAQQYPGKMARLGVEAIYNLATTGRQPSASPGLDFYDTGVQLVTDTPVPGVESIGTEQAATSCWG